MAATAALPSILLILAAVATIAVAHHRPPPTNETIVLKKCSDALGPHGGPLVSFCAKDLLGHRAALLASCGKRETLAVVLKETHKRAEAVTLLEKKIDSDRSLSGKELQDLKMCWGAMNAVVNSVNLAVTNNLSYDVMGGIHAKSAAAKEKCRMVPASEKHSGLWKELNVKVKASLEAQVVAFAFLDQLHLLH